MTDRACGAVERRCFSCTWMPYAEEEAKRRILRLAPPKKIEKWSKIDIGDLVESETVENPFSAKKSETVKVPSLLCWRFSDDWTDI